MSQKEQEKIKPTLIFYTPQEREYLKDIWDIKNFGVTPSKIAYNYILNFTEIKQTWLKEAAKTYAKYDLTVSALSTVRSTIAAINKFSDFIVKSCPNLQFNEINRKFVVNFLSYLAKITPNLNTRSSRISRFRVFLHLCKRENWLALPEDPLIYREDYPKTPRTVPKYIPQEVLDQLNEHLIDLPKPYARMLLVLQECGMRISELCTLKFDCIAQDATGSWWLTYYQSKMNKEHTVPISKEIAEVVRQQQEYIKENLGSAFSYLFCAREKGRGGKNKGIFIPKAEPVKYQSLYRGLNRLAEDKNICDASGRIFPLGKVHQFRHTAATSMVNNGVPIDIIRRFFGWETYAMVLRYTHLHDETLKQAVQEYHSNKVVNIAGESVKSERPELDTVDMQWFKKNIQAQALPNGYCGLPKALNDCPHANACLTCGHFRTSKEFLNIHKRELENINKIIEKAQANGWKRQIEMNQKVKRNLENIIKSLESKDEK